MLCFDVYYTMFVVFCQVFVTSFLKVFLRKFFVVLSCLIHPWVGVVSTGAVVLGARRVFGWFGLVRVLGFSCLGPLASRVRGFMGLLGCLYGVCGFVALGGLLGV